MININIFKKNKHSIMQFEINALFFLIIKNKFEINIYPLNNAVFNLGFKYTVICFQ